MASVINNPQNAMKGLEFALGAGRLPWGGAGGRGIVPDATEIPAYDVGPAGPAPVLYGGMGEVKEAMPSRVGDGMKPLGEAMPGKGGPGDIMGRLDKLEETMPMDRGAGPMLPMGGSQTMPLTGPQNPGPMGPMGGGTPGPNKRGAMKGLSQALGGGMY